MKSKILGLLAVALLLGTGASKATALIDQNNPNVGLAFCTFNSSSTGLDNLCGQSFQQSNANISGAGIFLAPSFTGSGTVTISIYQNYGTPSTGLIATGTSSVVNQDSGWVDAFWSPVAISPGTTYFMVLSSSSSLAMSNDASNSAGGQYASGNALATGCAGCYQNYDLVFRTYYDAAVGVPEPGTLALLGLGLAGLGLSRRRKA